MFGLLVTSDDCAGSNGKAVLRVKGELDVATRPHLMEAAAEALVERPRLLIVDLQQLEFCDAAGVHTLASVRQLARLHATDAVVCGASGLVRQVADTLGIDLRFEEDMDHALALVA
jgi:anti-sigma B factor antagonist